MSFISNQKGFGISGILVVVVALAIIVGAGLFVYISRDSNGDGKSKKSDSSQEAQSSKVELGEQYISQDGYAFKYPSSWEFFSPPATDLIPKDLKEETNTPILQMLYEPYSGSPKEYAESKDKVSSGQEKTINGHKAFLYDVKTEDVQYRKYVVTNGSKAIAFMFRLASARSNEAPARDYSKYTSEVEAIVGSLQFVPTEMLDY